MVFSIAIESQYATIYTWNLYDLSISEDPCCWSKELTVGSENDSFKSERHGGCIIEWDGKALGLFCENNVATMKITQYILALP